VSGSVDPSPEDVVEPRWHVYVLRCADDTLYTGVAVDVFRRLYYHNLGRGAKYTRSRTPVSLHHSEGPMTRSEALRREIVIKRLSRADKEHLGSPDRREGEPDGQR